MAMLREVLASPHNEEARERSDLVLICEDGTEYYAHCSVLRFFSKFFFNMLEGCLAFFGCPL